MEKLFERFRGQQMVKRAAIMLIAVMIMGMGVGFFMHAAMGSDPFSTLNLGVSSKLDLSFGVWQAIFNAILLIMIVFVDRSKLGIGTIGNMLLVGFSADIMSGLLANILPPASELGIISRVAHTDRCDMCWRRLCLRGSNRYRHADDGLRYRAAAANIQQVSGVAGGGPEDGEMSRDLCSFTIDFSRIMVV